jgi:hypothetical protein
MPSKNTKYYIVHLEYGTERHNVCSNAATLYVTYDMSKIVA